MNIIINGASSGIGRETALRLSADKDNQILITGRNETEMKRMVKESINENISCVRLDLAHIMKETKSIKYQIFNRFSRVDILLNIAGTLIVKDFMELSDNESREMMDVNFFGPAALTRLVVPLMPRGSHIVNISSMGGYQGSSKYRGLSVYSASKAALSSLSECLSLELADRGIIVNCLALGSVQTEMFLSAFPGFNAPVTPEGMAEFIGWFAVNGNRFFNGKVLPVALGNP